MATYNEHSCQSCRRSRITNLNDALRDIGSYRRYLGAVCSTTIDFDARYNSAEQRRKYGYRSVETIEKLADAALEDAKNEFKAACVACEFSHEGCGTKEEKEKLFWQIVNDPEARERITARLKNAGVKSGRKGGLTCARLLSDRRINPTEWK
ncbi:hypothetical protein EOM60_04740 [Candidatus Saccharibacteria bacterium]|nr:hypothetical protein [Candidatus Saccharibacteria bacterium]